MIAVTGVDGVELENEDGTIDTFNINIARLESYRRTGLSPSLRITERG